MNSILKRSAFVASMTISALGLLAQPVVTDLAPWASPATGESLARQAILPEGADAGSSLATVVYLKNLAAPRVGTDSDTDIIDSFLAEGMLVVTVDFAGHARARVPFLSDDIVRIRQDIRDDQQDGSATRFPTGYQMDNSHIFLVPEGCRLVRDLVFEDVSGITRAMDIIYPANPLFPSGSLIQISYDNQNRMNSANLANFNDSFVTAFASEGFATAMADHPVAGGYDGIDPMPGSALSVRAAVRAVRAQSEVLGLNGRIATTGFSRGSGVALFAVTTRNVQEWKFYLNKDTFITQTDQAFREARDAFPDEDASVQGAILLSGRFSYIDLLENDPNLAKYTNSWGPIESYYDRWEYMGALDFLEGDPGYPIFLSVNTNEDEHANHQMDVIMQRLDGFGAEYIYMPDTTVLDNAHRVPLVHSILNGMTEYLRSVLMDPSPAQVLASIRFQPQLLPENRIRWTASEPLPPLDYALQSSDSLSTWDSEDPVRPDASGILSIERDIPSAYGEFIRLLPPQPPME